MSQVRGKLKGQEQESFVAALGFVAGALFGIHEFAWLVLAGQLFAGPVSWLVLGVITIGLPGLLGGLLGSLVYLLKQNRRVGFCLSTAGVGLLFLGEWWLTDPPPFSPRLPFQGNLPVFVAFSLFVVVPMAMALARIRGWFLAVLVFSVVLLDVGWAVRWNESHRQLSVATEGPNLLLITIDTARADRFIRGRQANFDRVAAQGARFQTAVAPIPVTGPSHMSLMTGKAPWEHGVLLNGGRLGGEHSTLADILSQNGFDTGAFVSAYVLSGKIGLDRGFDVYGDHFGWLRGIDAVLLGRLWELWQRYQDPWRLLERRASDTTDEALGWLTKRESRWFAWVHLFDPHGPYLPPPPYDNRFYQGHDPRSSKNKSMEAVSNIPEYMTGSLEGITDLSWVKAQYDGEISYVDAQIGRLLDRIDASFPNTVVVVVGDHGEGLGEEGEWFQHGDFLYEHDLRVPLAIRAPQSISPGKVISEPVSTVWLFDTMLDYLGISDGKSNSLRELIEGGRRPSELVHAMCLDREANRVDRLADPQFVPKWRMAASWAPGLLYVVRDSPRFDDRLFLVAGGEVSEEEQGKTSQLKQAAASILTSGNPTIPELPDGERHLLEALGYVDPNKEGP